MIDLNTEFRRMAEEFEISDKEVLSSVRTMIRSCWGDSIFKTEFLKRNSVLIPNTNTRSMKRFPMVRKYRCAICGEMFGSTEVELDHIESENTLTSYEHINDFMTNIVLTSPDKLQVLCKDKKTKKGGIVRFGCHNLKSYSERYNVSLEQAKAEKQAIELIKQKKDKLYLQQCGISVPSNAAARRKAIVAHKLSLLKEKDDECI
jgi:hypothetical protein